MAPSAKVPDKRARQRIEEMLRIHGPNLQTEAEFRDDVSIRYVEKVRRRDWCVELWGEGRASAAQAAFSNGPVSQPQAAEPAAQSQAVGQGTPPSAATPAALPTPMTVQPVETIQPQAKTPAPFEALPTPAGNTAILQAMRGERQRVRAPLRQFEDERSSRGHSLPVSPLRGQVSPPATSKVAYRARSSPCPARSIYRPATPTTPVATSVHEPAAHDPQSSPDGLDEQPESSDLSDMEQTILTILSEMATSEPGQRIPYGDSARMYAEKTGALLEGLNFSHALKGLETAGKLVVDGIGARRTIRVLGEHTVVQTLVPPADRQPTRNSGILLDNDAQLDTNDAPIVTISCGSPLSSVQSSDGQSSV